MTNLEKVKAVSDESGHWYLIPNRLDEQFNILHELSCNDDYDAQNKFIEIFSEYMTGGDLNNVQLYAEI